MKRNFLLKSNLVLALLSLLVFQSAKIPPDTFWPAGFMTMAILPVLILNLLFLITWLIKTSWKIIIPLIVLGFGYSFIHATFSLSFHEKTGHANSIKVLSYNVRVFNSYKYLKSKHKQMPLNMLKYITDTDADIICMQEFYNKPKAAKFNIAERLHNSGYPYSACYYSFTNQKGGQFGIAVFSKYPIMQDGKLSFTNATKNQAMYTDIKINDKILRVYNLHLQSLYISEKEITKGKFDQKSTGNIINVFKRIKQGYIERTRQLKVVCENIKKTDKPVIMCGDFNDTPYSYNYQHLSENFDNAFEAKGLGTGITYNGNMPFLRIDNQFYDPSTVRILDFETESHINYSDHYPIWAEYQLL